MIIVREVFIAKPGMASKLAKMFKEQMGDKFTIMTDLTGVYNKVVAQAEYENLEAWAKEMNEWMDQSQKEKSEPEKSDSSKPKHTDMYNQGKREIYRVW